MLGFSSSHVGLCGVRQGSALTLHYIKSYLECPKSLGPLELYMRLKE